MHMFREHLSSYYISIVKMLIGIHVLHDSDCPDMLSMESTELTCCPSHPEVPLPLSSVCVDRDRDFELY